MLQDCHHFLQLDIYCKISKTLSNFFCSQANFIPFLPHSNLIFFSFFSFANFIIILLFPPQSDVLFLCCPFPPHYLWVGKKFSFPSNGEKNPPLPAASLKQSRSQSSTVIDQSTLANLSQSNLLARSGSHNSSGSYGTSASANSDRFR